MTPAQIKRKLAVHDKAAAAELAKAAKRTRELWVIQAQCPHPDVVEGAYSDGYYSRFDPFLVCRVCGYSEASSSFTYRLNRFDNGKSVPPICRETRREPLYALLSITTNSRP